MEFDASCQRLGLVPAPDGVWFGVIDGHVVALFGKHFARGHGEKVHVEGSPGAEFATPSLTIQVSHANPAPKRVDAAEVKCGPHVDPLIESGTARCVTESHRSLLFIYDARLIETFDYLSEVIRGFLSGLEAAGIPLRGRRCHWCGLRDVPDSDFLEGRATRMCEICINERQARMAATRPFTGFGGMVAAVGAAFAIPVSAGIAAGLQIAWDSLLTWWGDGRSGHVHAPRLVMIILVVGYSLAVAAPIALALRQVRTRGDRFAAGLAFVACLVAAILAEVFVVAWFVGYQPDWPAGEFISFALQASWENADFGMFVRVMLAAAAGIAAAIMVRPKQAQFFD